jgi:translation initiation factor IF-2
MYETSEYGERIIKNETEIINIKESEKVCKQQINKKFNEIFGRLNKLELTDARLAGIIVATSAIAALLATLFGFILQIILR